MSVYTTIESDALDGFLANHLVGGLIQRSNRPQATRTIMRAHFTR
jgi:hypothetical protein